MSRKREGREQARRTVSMGRANPVTYRCSNCERPRSSTYHARHPSWEPPPTQGVCRRCIGKEPQEQAPMIFEIHHYHHACTCQLEQIRESTLGELPSPPVYPGYTELPEDGVRQGNDGPLGSNRLQESRPPPVTFSTKLRGR